MSAPQYRKITDGIVALALVDTAAIGYLPEWQTPGGVDLATITVAEYATGPDADTWKCQVTEAFVSASANTSTEDVPDGYCGVGTTITVVKGSSFALNMTWVQDEFTAGGGLVGWAYDHDAEEAYFLIAGDSATGAARLGGRCWVSAGQVFGTANTINSSSAVWNCDRKPDAEWPPAVVADEAAGDARLDLESVDA